MSTFRAFGWMFRSRETGRIVILQWPNIPLWIFVVASSIKRFAHPHGTVGAVVAVVTAVSVLWFAIDEIIRGVNPFRRILGAVVAITTVAGLLMR